MQLTKEQMERLLAMLRTRWGEFRCEVCNNEAWLTADRLYTPIVYSEGDTYIGGPGLLPLAAVTCARCGNTKWVNTIALGLIDPATGRWADAE